MNTKKNEMYSYKHNGIHITVNSITELEEAEKNIENFKTNQITKWNKKTSGKIKKY